MHGHDEVGIFGQQRAHEPGRVQGGGECTHGGVAGWVSEAMGHGEGLSFGAMGWFILAESMIFMSVFAADWVMRLDVAQGWPPSGTVPLPRVVPLVMTAVLAVKCATTAVGIRIQTDRGQDFRQWSPNTLAVPKPFHPAVDQHARVLREHHAVADLGALLLGPIIIGKRQRRHGDDAPVHGGGLLLLAGLLGQEDAALRHPLNLDAVSYTHLRAHETVLDLVCRLLLEKTK